MKRKLLSVVLALALVISMTIPALADQETWSGIWGGIEWDFTIFRGASNGRVTMDIEPINVVVGAHGCAFIQATVDGTKDWSQWSQWYQSMTSTVNVGNYIYTEEGDILTGTILSIQGKGYIGSGDTKTLVANHFY